MANRKPFMAGNWKMNMDRKQASGLVESLIDGLKGEDAVDIAVAPPFTSLETVGRLVEATNIDLAAQNLFWEPNGAYTGEISPPMLVDLGVKYVIIGHSERRAHFGESIEDTSRKFKAALEHGLTPILCVGEKLEEREAGVTQSIVGRQLAGALEGLTAADIGEMVVAYEPVWAIGTGRTATPDQAQEVQAHIREMLSAKLGEEQADATRIQYGGSVKPDNVDELMAEEDIDGALVGGASLKTDSFARIVKFEFKG